MTKALKSSACRFELFFIVILSRRRNIHKEIKTNFLNLWILRYAQYDKQILVILSFFYVNLKAH